MSVEALLFGLIGLIWMIAGLASLTAPAWWNERIGRWMQDPVARFLAMQGMMLNGLILVIGMSAQQAWFWVIVGALLIVLSLGLLGSPAVRARLLDRWAHVPQWMHRLAGMGVILLATLLVLDAWRAAP